jgi:hypothetical protein
MSWTGFPEVRNIPEVVAQWCRMTIMRVMMSEHIGGVPAQ